LAENRDFARAVISEYDARKVITTRETECPDRFNFSTDEGIQTDNSAEHSANALSQRTEILQSRSNSKRERRLQAAKQDFAIVSTDEGTQIDCSAEQFANALSPRIRVVQFCANDRLKRLSQPEKQHFPIAPTNEGIQIDCGSTKLAVSRKLEM
jgi:hypothetical protein